MLKVIILNILLSLLSTTTCYDVAMNPTTKDFYIIGTDTSIYKFDQTTSSLSWIKYTGTGFVRLAVDSGSNTLYALKTDTFIYYYSNSNWINTNTNVCATDIAADVNSVLFLGCIGSGEGYPIYSLTIPVNGNYSLKSGTVLKISMFGNKAMAINNQGNLYYSINASSNWNKFGSSQFLGSDIHVLSYTSALITIGQTVWIHNSTTTQINQYICNSYFFSDITPFGSDIGLAIFMNCLYSALLLS